MMNNQEVNKILSSGGILFFLFLLLTIKVQATVQYNEAMANAWCSSDLNALLNDEDEGYLSLFSVAERSYLLDTECGVGNKITLVSKNEWDNTEILAGVWGRTRSSKDWYRWAINGSDSGNYAPNGVSGFWTNTPYGVNTNVYVVNANTGITTTASVTDDANYEVLPAIRLDPANACVSDAVGTKNGSLVNPYDVESGYCVVSINKDDTNIVVSKDEDLVIAGAVNDSHGGKTITISATIGGVLKTTTATTPAMGKTWELNWSLSEMSEMTHDGVVINFTDGVKNGAVDYLGTIIIDKTDPECGNWTPNEAAWKIIPGATEFTLANPTDVGGSELATISSTLSCKTGPIHGETCSATIVDYAGNSKICVSPVNRVDNFAPILQVTPPIQGFQNDKQNLIVTSTDDQTSIQRIAYSWSMNNLGTDCTGGTEINSGDDLKFKIMGGENTLYVCSVDLAGNVARYQGVYCYTPPVFTKPDLNRQVTAPNLYWNILSVAETQSYVEVKGFFPRTQGSANYEIELIIPTINKSYVQALQTSPYNEVYFSFIIPTVDFKASKDNHTFSGPQKLKITDLDQMEAATIDYNLTFFFPIHQTNHKRDFNYYIFSSDNRLNDLVEE